MDQQSRLLEGTVRGNLLILRIQFSVCFVLIFSTCRSESKQRSNISSSSQNSPPENHHFQHIDDSASRHKVVSAHITAYAMSEQWQVLHFSQLKWNLSYFSSAKFADFSNTTVTVVRFNWTRCWRNSGWCKWEPGMLMSVSMSCRPKDTGASIWADQCDSCSKPHHIHNTTNELRYKAVYVGHGFVKSSSTHVTPLNCWSEWQWATFDEMRLLCITLYRRLKQSVFISWGFVWMWLKCFIKFKFFFFFCVHLFHNCL